MEPCGDEGGLPDDQALAAQAEDEAAEEHGGHGVDRHAEGRDDLPRQHEEGEDDDAGAHAHGVHQVPAWLLSMRWSVRWEWVGREVVGWLVVGCLIRLGLIA